MIQSNLSDDSIEVILNQLKTKSANISNLCDKIYHYNKSLGVTYTTIRYEISKMNHPDRIVALQNFLKVIDELKSPTLFINLESLD
jgi:hypothetical protein